MKKRDTFSRRDVFKLGGGLSAAALVAAAASRGGVASAKSPIGIAPRQASPSAANVSGEITIWDISTGDSQTIAKNIVAKFNESHPKIKAKIEFFQNDPYKQKLQVAMGAGNPPDLFFGWGGGILKSYVDAGKVYDITGKVDISKFIPSVMAPVTFDKKIYGIPINNVQPEVFEYNTEIFKDQKLTPPKTWDDLMNAVSALKKNNIIPIALAGQNKWPGMMYNEFLTDRIGGPSVFNDIVANKPNAWSNPAVIKASTMVQQLVDAGAFEPGFSSVNADLNQSSALLWSGKAAMQLMGVWDYGTILSNEPSFITSGKYGTFPFPAVTGGEGDPSNLYGNLSNFYSVSAASKNKDAAVVFLQDAVLNDYAIDQYIGLGLVPPVIGIESKLKAAKHADFLMMVYTITKQAKNFQLSWDQDLPPATAQAVLTNVDQLFLKQITPQQFSDNLNKTIKTS